ncbi:hypothetical protein GOV14_02625 [Candidatus Pacearchaeota archaeon]|nr:hypothetical protein [Candidatus Pacearchaeota archaeon]
MKFIRAFALGTVLWIFIFVTSLFLVYVLKLRVGFWHYLIYWVAIIIFALVLSLAYFHANIYFHMTATYGFLQGLILGVTFVVIVMALDVLIVVPFFLESRFDLIKLDVILGHVFTLIVASFIGFFKSRVHT